MNHHTGQGGTAPSDPGPLAPPRAYLKIDRGVTAYEQPPLGKQPYGGIRLPRLIRLQHRRIRHRDVLPNDLVTTWQICRVARGISPPGSHRSVYVDLHIIRCMSRAWLC
jgi:hypothetical protein